MANEVTSSINFKYLSKEAESFLDNAGDNFLHSVYNLSEDVDINDRSWYEELDKFFDSEYDCFLQCHKEYLEELEED
jgi:hypothetical protein